MHRPGRPPAIASITCGIQRCTSRRNRRRRRTGRTSWCNQHPLLMMLLVGCFRECDGWRKGGLLRHGRRGVYRRRVVRMLLRRLVLRRRRRQRLLRMRGYNKHLLLLMLLYVGLQKVLV